MVLHRHFDNALYSIILKSSYTRKVTILLRFIYVYNMDHRKFLRTPFISPPHTALHGENWYIYTHSHMSGTCIISDDCKSRTK